jgi:hypothetical protein
MANEPVRCQWQTLQQALDAFVLNVSGTQGQGHIRPLHHYLACRLVVEGGFAPSDITPHPPFVVKEERGGRKLLNFDETAGKSGELTVLGGLKTKAVDVAVTKAGIGPVIAISGKGTLKAFRNLMTNRMEEAIGDCANLHISYPALVLGFIHVLRASRPGEGIESNDVCVSAEGSVTDLIARYHNVLARLEGRRDLRDDETKYEAVALALVKPDTPDRGTVLPNYPPPDSPLLFNEFFDKVYRAYDLRFVYPAPNLEAVRRRMVWDPASPALDDPRAKDYAPRVGTAE